MYVVAVHHGNDIDATDVFNLGSDTREGGASSKRIIEHEAVVESSVEEFEHSMVIHAPHFSKLLSTSTSILPLRRCNTRQPSNHPFAHITRKRACFKTQQETDRREASGEYTAVERDSTKLQTRISSSEWVVFRVSGAR